LYGPPRGEGTAGRDEASWADDPGFALPQQAVTAAAPGDILILRAGNYTNDPPKQLLLDHNLAPGSNPAVRSLDECGSHRDQARRVLSGAVASLQP